MEIHTALEAIDEEASFEESNSSTVGEEAVEKPSATAHRGSLSSVEGEAEGAGSYSDIVRLHVCAGHECPVGGACHPASVGTAPKSMHMHPLSGNDKMPSDHDVRRSDQ